MIVSNSYEKRRLALVASACKGKTVLDLGYAQLPNPYLEGKYRVGFDLEKPLPGLSRYEEEVVGDVTNINEIFKGRTFDTIICGELLEHLENPYELMRDMRSLLSDDGVLVISTPNPLGFPNFLAELFWSKSYFYTNQHLYYFLPRWVERIIEHTGYNLIKAKPVGLWFPWFVIPFCPKIFSYQVIYIANKGPLGNT